MNEKRKGRPPKARPEDSAPAAAGGDDFEDEQDGLDSLPWAEDFHQWREEESPDGGRLDVVLYRLVKGNGKERVWKWTDEIPDEHNDIGLVFGSGKYMVYATLVDTNGRRHVRHRSFNLSASYDAAIKAAERAGGGQVVQAAGGAMAGAAMPGFEMMIMMMERIVLPLVAGRQAAAPAAGGFDHWNAANEIVGRVVEASASAQLRMSGEVGKLLAGGGAGGGGSVEAEDPTEDDFKIFLKEMIREYGPALLEAGTLKLKTIAGVVKRDEVFQALSSNEDLFRRVVGLVAKDPEMDSGMVERVLEKLKGIGIAIPILPGFKLPTSGARPPVSVPPVHVNGSGPGT